MEIPSSQGGVVKEVKVKLGDMVKQGSVVLTLEAAGAAASAPVEAPKQASTHAAPAQDTPNKVALASAGPTPAPAPTAASFSGAADLDCELLDTFTVFVPAQSGSNMKDFELFAGNVSPTGPFESIGRFSTQNMRMMQAPYQAFRFPSVKAKYFKLQSLRSHDDSGASFAYEIQLFGELQ